MSALWSSFLDAADATGHRRELAEAGFAGWVAFVRATTVASLVDGTITPSENHQMCMAALDSTVGAHVDLQVTPRA
ncbi:MULTISPECIES: hypothetical protein [unclassified Gordonia (in: high G+C Gram-positive bacteria)]